MHHRTRIKICGITTAADAAAAVEAGADAIGVVLAPSPRRVTLEQAATVFEAVPPFVARVGVFVDASPHEVAAAIARLGLSAVQFSGAELPEDCSAAPAPAIKALHVGIDFDGSLSEPYRGYVAALLVDTFSQGEKGGTGQTFDWQLLDAAPRWAPLLLAGGLHPGNVGEAIAAVQPFAVDVSSGVERAAGVKDHDKIRDFCAAVRLADAALIDRGRLHT